MRYYRIVIKDQDGKPWIFQSLRSPQVNAELSSLLPPPYSQNPQNGVTNPAALQVELDIAVANLSDPDNSQGAAVTIYGLGLEDIGRATELSRNYSIEVYGGMAQGLPLANPSQSGLLVQGQIWQAFGNWVGTVQCVTLQLVPGAPAIGTAATPGNIPFVHAAGTKLGDAIKQTFSVAVPNLQASVNVSGDLVANYDQTGHYPSLGAFAEWIKPYSKSLKPDPTYPGVTIVTDGQTISAFDGSVAPPAVKQIAFSDLIGQPTWLNYQVVSIAMVMRADIHVGDVINLPRTLATATPNSGIGIQGSQTSQSSLTFSGDYQVLQVHHYGNYRQPSADAWVTMIQATPVQRS